MKKWAISLAASAALIAAAPYARADTTDAIRAEALFDEGRRLMQAEMTVTLPESAFSDGTNVWVNTPSAIYKCLVGAPCGTPAPFADNQTNAWNVIADSKYVYWTVAIASPKGAIMRCPVSGCGPGGPAAIVSGADYPVALVQDATALYYTDGVGVRRLAK